MSETKARLASEVQRLSAVCREAASLIEVADGMCEPIEPQELARLIAPLRTALYGAKTA